MDDHEDIEAKVGIFRILNGILAKIVKEKKKKKKENQMLRTPPQQENLI